MKIVDQVVEKVLGLIISPSPGSSNQVGVCGAGEACLLYTWQKSRTETGFDILPILMVVRLWELCISGSYRECFSTSVQLGHPDFPLTPQVWCLWLFQWEWHFDEIFSAVQLDVSGLAIRNGRLWLWLPVNCCCCRHRQSLQFLSLDWCKVALKPIGCIGR